MDKVTSKLLSKVIRIDESEIRSHLDRMVLRTVEETLNALFEAEADEMCLILILGRCLTIDDQRH